MELTCMSCLHEFEGNISLDELGWHGVCPKCGASFPVEVPKGRIVMAFVDDSDDSRDGEHFTDDFRGKNTTPLTPWTSSWRRGTRCARTRTGCGIGCWTTGS